MVSLTEQWQEQEQVQGGYASAPCNPVTVCPCRWAKRKIKKKGLIILIVEFFLPMKKIPTTTHQQKKVAVLNGKVRHYEPESLAEARSKFMSALYPHAPADEMKGPIRLTVKWLFPMTKKSEDGQYKISKPDLDNLMKLLKDCMTDLAFWKDDAQVASLVTEKFYAKQVGIYVKAEEMKL